MLILACVCGITGCSPSGHERDAKERARFELEEKQRQEAVQANRAITQMTEKAFRLRTPEEETKHRAEVAKQAQAILEAKENPPPAEPSKP